MRTLLALVLSVFLLSCEKIPDYEVKVGAEVLINNPANEPICKGTIIEFTSDGIKLKWTATANKGKTIFVPHSNVGSVTRL
ncbi:MAG: hypothetical protein VX646_07750 [Verrucomicrobiota bacterium]|nr:hypothetical protein [Verrucomicrobiota bacterium]